MCRCDLVCIKIRMKLIEPADGCFSFHDGLSSRFGCPLPIIQQAGDGARRCISRRGIGKLLKGLREPVMSLIHQRIGGLGEAHHRVDVNAETIGLKHPRLHETVAPFSVGYLGSLKTVVDLFLGSSGGDVDTRILECFECLTTAGAHPVNQLVMIFGDSRGKA